VLTKAGADTGRCPRIDDGDAMLLNEFLKEHWKVNDLETIVAREAADEQQQRQIKALSNLVQKVTDQLSITKAALPNPANRR
jgi:hypothetical protein